MGWLTRLTGSRCPTCGEALTRAQVADLLEEIPLSAPMPTVDCPRCGKALRLAGSRWDQAMRLFLLHALPPLVVAQLFSGVAGFVLALALLPFSFRAVALERAR